MYFNQEISSRRKPQFAKHSSDKTEESSRGRGRGRGPGEESAKAEMNWVEMGLCALTGVAQWVGHRPAQQKVTS